MSQSESLENLIHFFSCPNSKHFLDKQIFQHLKSLQNSLENRSHDHIDAFNFLNNPQTWVQIKHRMGENQKLMSLNENWTAFGYFAGHNSNELISLYEDHIIAINHYFGLLQSDLQNTIEYKKNFSWFQQNIEKDEKRLQALDEQYQNFNAWQKSLEDFLVYKANLHQVNESSRFEDDFLYFTMQSINEESQEGLSVHYPAKPNVGLDDDTRIVLYDLMQSKTESHTSELDELVDCIHQIPIRPPLTHHDVQSENREFNAFVIKMEKFFKFKMHYQLQDAIDQKTKYENIIKESVLKWFSHLQENQGLVHFLASLYQYRKAIIPAFMILLTLMVAPIVSAALSIYIGNYIASFISQALFYTVTISTFAYSGYELFSNLKQKAKLYFSHNKDQKVQQALEQLQNNHKFIQAKLNAGILDLSHFDVLLLEKSVLHRIKQLEQLNFKLKRTSFAQKLFMQGEYKQNFQQVISKIESQSETLKQRLKKLAKYIVEKIDVDVERLTRSSLEANYQPKIPQGQFKNLRYFVQKYADSSDLAAFDEQTNIISRFQKSVINLECLDRGFMPGEFSLPWGKSIINDPKIKGWNTLIEHMAIVKEQKLSAQKLLEALKGDVILNHDELISLVKDLNIHSAAEFIEKFQEHIFQSLENRSIKATRIFNNLFKQKLIDWYLQNKQEINEAITLFSDIFENNENANQYPQIQDEQLARYFSLLDGAKYLKYVNVPGGIAHIRNSAKNYFIYYNGEHDRAVYLLRFLPFKERKFQLKEVAIKRLFYFLSNGTELSRFTFSDLELFLNDEHFNEPYAFSFPLAVKQFYEKNPNQSHLAQNSLDTLIQQGLVTKREKQQIITHINTLVEPTGLDQTRPTSIVAC